MKKLILSLFIFTFILSGFNLPKAQAATSNLVPNPTFETMDPSGSSPLGWQMGSWGTNSNTFQYLKDTSGISLSVQINSYTSGDAKWYFNPVTVSPSAQYSFSDSYIANVPTDLVVYQIDQQGKESFQYLGTATASSTWKKTAYIFTIPSNISQISIFHFISRVGLLQINNFSLTPYSVVVTPGGIPNGSLEQTSILNSNLPDNWQTGTWGTNKTTFSYLNTGHTGSHSVKIAMSGRTSGASEWYYTPQQVTPGQTYKFSDYYKATVPTEVEVMINKTDGSVQYLTLGIIGASSSWYQFSTTFVMPAGAQTASIMHIIYNNGTLTTDDYSLAPYAPLKFSRPLISLTFDDGYSSYSTAALPAMKQYGYKSTAYIITGEVGDTAGGYMTLAQIKAAYAAGNEIGSHTVTHPDLNTLTVAKITTELVNSKSYLQRNVTSAITDFAAPYGSANPNTITQIKKFYATNRSVDAGYNSPDNFNPYHILVQNIDITTTSSDVQGWVNYAKQNNCWLVLVYHEVDNSGDTYSVKPTNFASQLKIINQSGISVLTLNKALAEVTPQVIK